MTASNRRPLFWLCGLAWAAASLSHQPSALADAPSDEAVIEQRRAAAKSKYQEGAAAYSAGHFKDAVDLFLAADRLAPSAPLSFNIARAYEKLADDAGALRWYRDYLRRNPEASNAATVRPLIAALAESLRKKGVQQLTVITSPPGATLGVDDQPVGITPWTGELSPGAHHLLLSLRGYADSESNLSLAADQPLDVECAPRAAADPSQRASPTSHTPTTPASERDAGNRGRLSREEAGSRAVGDARCRHCRLGRRADVRAFAAQRGKRRKRCTDSIGVSRKARDRAEPPNRRSHFLGRRRSAAAGRRPDVVARQRFVLTLHERGADLPT